jgi:hypothetical protein
MGTNASCLVSIFLADGFLVGTNRAFFYDGLTVQGGAPIRLLAIHLDRDYSWIIVDWWN